MRLTTGGGAHPGNPRHLSAHFMMFVPNGRSINPVTHTDWEGVGVVPDDLQRRIGELK
jgi:hypothetical protein